MNKDSDIVKEEDPLIILGSKSTVCMAEKCKYTEHTRKIEIITYFLRNGEKCKMNNIELCKGGLQLAEIATKNFGEDDLTPRIKYIIRIRKK